MELLNFIRVGFTGNRDRSGFAAFIRVDTLLTEASPLPSVAVVGHRKLKGVTNVLLDHHHAAELALSHLVELGHERPAG
jgi:DNA-binding LacI/PurR family transcriptional regulator